jgi:hypothetical protein
MGDSISNLAMVIFSVTMMIEGKVERIEPELTKRWFKKAIYSIIKLIKKCM